MIKIIYNYVKIFLWSGITFIDYKLNNKINILFVEILLHNIQNTSSLCLKCIQKVIPYLKMINYDKDIINVLDNVYENNVFHDDNYTKYIYKKDKLENIDDKYIILDKISSGSIGQVYIIKHKESEEKYALKVKHPNINNDLYIISLFIWIFNLYKYSFFDLKTFIRNFTNECNFINEANNMKLFSRYYENNDKIIIPKVDEYSENIIIMEYIEGVHLEELSNFNRIKYMSLLVLFCNNNRQILNMNHGDLHFGNFKKKDDSLVIYDFGYCFSVDDNLFIESIDYTYHHILERSNLKYSYQYCINNIIKYHISSKDNIDNYKEDIHDIFLSNKPQNISDIVVKCYIFFTKNNIKISIDFLNLIINYYFMSEYNDTNMLDLIAYCETYNVFTDYINYVKNENIELYRKKEKIEYYNKELAEELKKLL